MSSSFSFVMRRTKAACWPLHMLQWNRWLARRERVPHAAIDSKEYQVSIEGLLARLIAKLLKQLIITQLLQRTTMNATIHSVFVQIYTAAAMSL